MATTLVQNINSGFERITVLLKQVSSDLNGKIGNRASLSTTEKTSLVLALNEVKALVDQASVIEDTSLNSINTWSGEKINNVVNSAITTLINSADLDSDTLKELADRITAVAQADQGLISAVAAQSFTEIQKEQARNNIDAVSATSVGNITTADFVAVVNAAYAGGV